MILVSETCIPLLEGQVDQVWPTTWIMHGLRHMFCHGMAWNYADLYTYIRSLFPNRFTHPKAAAIRKFFTIPCSEYIFVIYIKAHTLLLLQSLDLKFVLPIHIDFSPHNPISSLWLLRSSGQTAMSDFVSRRGKNKYRERRKLISDVSCDKTEKKDAGNIKKKHWEYSVSLWSSKSFSVRMYDTNLVPTPLVTE